MDPTWYGSFCKETYNKDPQFTEEKTIYSHLLWGPRKLTTTCRSGVLMAVSMNRGPIPWVSLEPELYYVGSA